MQKFLLSLLVLLTVVNTSCETDFDVLAPYEETMVVYGLLNASEKTQYVRINKAFVGEGDALVFAQNPDSIYYADILRVKIEQWKNSVLVDSMILIRDTSKPKDPGVFANSPNVLYKTGPNDTVLDFDSQYRLIVTNLQSGKVVTAETPIVGDITPLNPNPNPLTKVTWTDPDGYTIRYNTAPNGRVYNLIIRFNYREVDPANPNDTLRKIAEWNLLNRVSGGGTGGTETITQNLQGEDFYRLVRNVITTADDYVFDARRFIGRIDFIYTIGADEFYTYVQVNQPSSGIVQNIPNFTNVNNGFGIFSSRNIFLIPDKEMDIFSKSELINGTIYGLTGDLNFQ